MISVSGRRAARLLGRVRRLVVEDTPLSAHAPLEPLPFDWRLIMAEIPACGTGSPRLPTLLVGGRHP
ncbi:hypothetical protein [Amycolatopsis sp. cmx-4-54]|uniref:hypothetical protein n=1 Tax=Amycolatopsis sp. cmx-4-54 TaxID=2790936 RepID=UPI00397B355A